jgi:hypothetical protein
VTVRPLSPLKDEARYTLRIKGVRDRVNKAMTNEHVASFQTVDITPPSIVSAVPAAGTAGAPIYTPLRITYSEAIDPREVLRSARCPRRSLRPRRRAHRLPPREHGDRVHAEPAPGRRRDLQVQVAPARDLAGLLQPAGASYAFTTTDRTPPELRAWWRRATAP